MRLARAIGTVFALLLIGVGAGASPAAAPRQQPSAQAREAHDAGRFADPFKAVSAELASCEAAPRTPGHCLDLQETQADWAADAGQMRGGEDFARRLLATSLRLFGERHDDIATCYSIVAFSLKAQRRFADADPLFRRSLAIDQALDGERHLETATALNNIATNLDAQFRYAEAEPLLRRALAILLEVNGRKDRTTAASYHNLASHLSARGRYAEAAPLVRQSLDIEVALVGEAHPRANIFARQVEAAWRVASQAHVEARR